MAKAARETGRTGIDPRQLRDVLGAFATGVVVVTTQRRDGEPVGLTVNSFNSVSLDPPLILWSLSLAAPSLPAFRSHDFFGINILSERQRELCVRFARPAADKFAGVRFDRSVGGTPLLHDAAAHLVCRTYARYPGGDHEIYVGEVLSIEDFARPPLVFHQGSFRRLADMIEHEG
ncbi:flavin reductase family protein [Propylenella binzhouense]|uniref:Flavin reductase n=1 Tax=Propylenella binzhouense TaxID=2555902 RepID=A0A964T6L8_9HYPH|nr:flavin reductase family protein [Propylenella binzhouense]MYZ49463.1 flavin reductase [Propylenella binzhouense]